MYHYTQTTPFGTVTQLETIRRWIAESDVFMLMLGGRYGTVEEESGKSYIQLEYEYALEKGKPVFAAVISERYLDEKVRAQGKVVLEDKHPDLYQSFRKTVLSRICRFFDDGKDLKLIVHESIPEVTRNRDLAGWVRGSDVLDPRPMLEEMAQLRAENAKLTKLAAGLEKRLSTDTYQGYSFEELLTLLGKDEIVLTNVPGKHQGKKAPLLNVFIACADQLGVGVENWAGMDHTRQFIFFELAPKLAVYGLVEKKSVNNKGIQRFQTSDLGNRFLAKAKPLFQQAIAIQESTNQEKTEAKSGVESERGVPAPKPNKGGRKGSSRPKSKAKERRRK
jgi:Domain of unknown function (DUF4062)